MNIRVETSKKDEYKSGDKRNRCIQGWGQAQKMYTRMKTSTKDEDKDGKQHNRLEVCLIVFRYR